MTQDATSEGRPFSGLGNVRGTSEYPQQQTVVVIGAILWLASIQYLCFPPTHSEEGSLPLQGRKLAGPSVLDFPFPDTPCNSDLPLFPALCTVANVNQPGLLRCLGISGHRLMVIGQSWPAVAFERRWVNLRISLIFKFL
jgi:hypothetical protein